MELIRNPIRTIISEFFEMFCYLIIVEEIKFFYNKDRLFTIRIIFELYQSKIGPKLSLLMLFVLYEHLIIRIL